MTDENRKRNVIDELARADQALRAARALVGLGLHADAVSRAYYAVLRYEAERFAEAVIEVLRHEGWTA